MIPLKLETLLKGRVVEHDRVEYKRGWNPAETIHTICAFANDFPNVNGGYIVIGIESTDGIPVLPPNGIAKERLDEVQQQIFQYCNMIEPRYIPKLEVINYRDSDIFLIYLRCSAGEGGPYQAPVEIYSSKKSEVKPDRTMRYWIRAGSVTAYAKNEELSELFDKFNAVPYDDRINRRATLNDIRRGYLEDFLRESNSSLVSELKTKRLTKTMNDSACALHSQRMKVISTSVHAWDGSRRTKTGDMKTVNTAFYTDICEIIFTCRQKMTCSKK